MITVHMVTHFVQFFVFANTQYTIKTLFYTMTNVIYSTNSKFRVQDGDNHSYTLYFFFSDWLVSKYAGVL